MHSQLGHTYINGVKGHKVSGKVAQRRAAQHIRPVMEGLEGNLCLLTQSLKESS